MLHRRSICRGYCKREDRLVHWHLTLGSTDISQYPLRRPGSLALQCLSALAHIMRSPGASRLWQFTPAFFPGERASIRQCLQRYSLPIFAGRLTVHTGNSHGPVCQTTPRSEDWQITSDLPCMHLLTVLGPLDTLGFNKALVNRSTQCFANQRIFAQIGQGLAQRRGKQR